MHTYRPLLHDADMMLTWCSMMTALVGRLGCLPKKCTCIPTCKVRGMTVSGTKCCIFIMKLLEHAGSQQRHLLMCNPNSHDTTKHSARHLVTETSQQHQHLAYMTATQQITEFTSCVHQLRKAADEQAGLMHGLDLNMQHFQQCSTTNTHTNTHMHHKA